MILDVCYITSLFLSEYTRIYKCIGVRMSITDEDSITMGKGRAALLEMLRK
jgi:hypothetical protein